MRRILPHPLLSLGLLVMWLLLNASLAPLTVLGGAALALALPFAMRRLEPAAVRVRAPRAIAALAGVVIVDMLRSNLAVARIILGGRRGERTSGFVIVPLEMRSPHGLAILAILITSVPGTLWVQYNASSGRLLMHVLDLVDEAEWHHLIKHRYERLLREIFE
jgi:multicomponent K+:H+ antiporter subunit E